jgi:hypothetical protein
MSASIQVMMLGTALIVWTAVAYKGWLLCRYPASRTAWIYWGGFAALACNLTLLMPPIGRWIDRTSGVPELTYLISDAAVFDNPVWPTVIIGNGPLRRRPIRRLRPTVPPFGAVAPACGESEMTRCRSR